MKAMAEYHLEIQKFIVFVAHLLKRRVFGLIFLPHASVLQKDRNLFAGSEAQEEL